MNVYVASSWRNPLQPGVVKQLREEGFNVYDFRNPREGETGFDWAHIDPRWKSWNPTEFRKALTHPIAVEGFALDFDAMKWANACVLVLPCGRSAHLEAGWFAGARRPVFIYSPESHEPELMYAMCNRVCVTIAEVLAELCRIRK